MEGLTDVIHVADASAIVERALDDDFMAIRNDAHKGRHAGGGGNPPLARGGRLPKMGSDVSERYLAIYDIDDCNPRNRDNAFCRINGRPRPNEFTPPELLS